MSAWATFWILCTAYVTAEATMYLKGHDTLLWRHKTPAELELQKKAIGKDGGE